MPRIAPLLSLALACTLAAQHDAFDFARARTEVLELLASPEPAAAARGAWLAQRLRLEDTLAPLRASLQAWLRADEDDAPIVSHYLVDALIQLGAEQRAFRIETTRSHLVEPWHLAHTWLLQMADSDAKRLGLPLHRFELVRWRDAEANADAYLDQVAAVRAQTQQALIELGRRLVVRGAMNAHERDGLVGPDGAVTIAVDVVDERRDRTVPLPELPSRR